MYVSSSAGTIRMNFGKLNAHNHIFALFDDDHDQEDNDGNYIGYIIDFFQYDLKKPPRQKEIKLKFELHLNLCAGTINRL